MRVMFVGDINLGEYYTAFGHGPRTYSETNDIFESVREVLSKADLVVGNLEAPITNHAFNPRRVESAVLRGNPKHANLLSSAGFKILQVANNHTVQHGPQGFWETVETLRALDIQPIGIANQSLVALEIGAQTVGFLAASDVPDNTDAQQTCYQRLDQAFLDRVQQSVKSVDHLFVMLHWGLESSTQTMDYQISIINDLSKIGVRGIIGAHPHLFYEVWRTNETVAAPSLGNFVFDLFWDSRLLKSGILDINLARDGIINCQVWPVSISEQGGQPTLTGKPQVLDDRLKLYDLGPDMTGEQTRKLKKFFSDFMKGNVQLKSQFILKKIVGKI